MEQTIFDKICDTYNLGQLIESPKQLTGGFMHKMYSLFTEQGRYAVKMLNPYTIDLYLARKNKLCFA